MEEQLITIKKVCANAGVKLVVSISIDGVEEVHDEVRGVTGAWDNASKTCMMLKRRIDLYDCFNVICTVSNYNVTELPAVAAWAKTNGLDISYNIATLNSRLDNENKYKSFSVLQNEESLSLAMEWFYRLYTETKSDVYYTIYLWLLKGKRQSSCVYMDRGVTLLPDGSILYCAPRGRIIANALQCDPLEEFKSHMEWRRDLCVSNCWSCGTYLGQLDMKGTLNRITDLIRHRGSIKWMIGIH